MTETAPLLLSDIRGALIRQEETIIFALIERAQFARNRACYDKRGNDSEILVTRVGSSVSLKEKLSFMEYFLVETESLHAKLGRYNSPDENAFFAPLLPKSVVPGQANTKVSPLKPNVININSEILGVYVESILGELCDNDGDDGEYGSTCACDIAVLQALSKRIHYGKFVAEAKFQAEKERFSEMIRKNDADGIMEALTNVAVEEKVIDRVRLKASRYGTDGTESTSAYKVDPNIIAKLYQDYLIPLNKKVQVAYLLQRLERPSYAYVEDKFAAIAAKEKFCDEGVKCQSINDVFLAVSRNQVAYGVVPIQGSSVGFFKGTQQALVYSKLRVCDCIQHNQSEEEWTRYYIISSVKPLGGGLSSHLVAFFGVRHAPGSLLVSLRALDGVNLCALESMHGLGNDQYAFFCEIEGKHMDTKAVEVIMKRLEQVSSFVTLSGAY